VAVSFHHHGELNILVHTVQVVKKSLSLSGPWAQMMKNVTSTMEAVMGLTGWSVQYHLIRVLHEEVGNNERQ
jgi:hypothetical protein